MGKVVDARSAINHIEDGMTVAILGSGGGICEPTYLLKELRSKYLEEQKPAGLTLLHANGIGDKDTFGTDALALEGLVKRDIAGHWGMAPSMAELALEEKIEAYNLPQGVISQMYHSIASHKPGVITKTGLNTFIDPRIEGGKMNASAKEDLVKIIHLEDEEWLFYPNIGIDVALIRGTTADENGNISYEEEAAVLDGVSIAQAARNSGGLVIAQVKYLAKAGTIPAKDVVIPGIYVDYIVVDENQCQTCERIYDPMLAGNVKAPMEQISPIPLNARKVVARRAAKDQTLQFNFYDGGGLDIAFLGMAQMDMEGNVNSSKTGRLLSGCGGAINISQNAKRVVFCGTFTAKGFQADIRDGEIKIISEGAVKKLVEQVDQITFSGKYARRVNQPVLYVTERAVFELTEEGIVLTEIAPGMDLEKDILSQMEARPLISPELKIMDKELFED